MPDAGDEIAQGIANWLLSSLRKYFIDDNIDRVVNAPSKMMEARAQRKAARAESEWKSMVMQNLNAIQDGDRRAEQNVDINDGKPNKEMFDLDVAESGKSPEECMDAFREAMSAEGFKEGDTYQFNRVGDDVKAVAVTNDHDVHRFDNACASYRESVGLAAPGGERQSGTYAHAMGYESLSAEDRLSFKNDLAQELASQGIDPSLMETSAGTVGGDGGNLSVKQPGDAASFAKIKGAIDKVGSRYQTPSGPIRSAGDTISAAELPRTADEQYADAQSLANHMLDKGVPDPKVGLGNMRDAAGNPRPSTSVMRVDYDKGKALAKGITPESVDKLTNEWMNDRGQGIISEKQGAGKAAKGSWAEKREHAREASQIISSNPERFASRGREAIPSQGIGDAAQSLPTPGGRS